MNRLRNSLPSHLPTSSTFKNRTAERGEQMDSEIRSAVRGVGSGGEGGVGRKAVLPSPRPNAARALGRYLQGEVENIEPRELEGLVCAFQAALSTLVAMKHPRRDEGHRELLQARLWKVRDLTSPALRSSRGAPRSPVPVAWVPSRPPGITGAQRRGIELDSVNRESGQPGEIP